MGAWLKSRNGRFISGTHCIGGWVDQSGQVRKTSPSPDFEPWTVQSVTSRYTDWDIPTPYTFLGIDNFI